MEIKIEVTACQGKKYNKEDVDSHLSPYIFLYPGSSERKKVTSYHLSPILRNARPIEITAIGA